MVGVPFFVEGMLCIEKVPLFFLGYIYDEVRWDGLSPQEGSPFFFSSEALFGVWKDVTNGLPGPFMYHKYINCYVLCLFYYRDKSFYTVTLRYLERVAGLPVTKST